MVEELVVGIDIGTSAVKAAVFDLNGTEHYAYASTYPTRRHGNIVEQSPDDWMSRIDEIFDAARGHGLADRIRAIGITSQVNTHLFVDAAGTPLAPAIVWQDGRCAGAAADLDARVTPDDRIRWWGAPMPIDASHCLSRMAWMARNAPALYERTRAVLLPKDYAILKLTGVWGSDPLSNIGLVGNDLSYVPDLLDLVPGASDRLVALSDPTGVAGHVRLADHLPGIPISVGVMDAWAGMFGVGVRRDGDAMYLSGTSEILGIVSKRSSPTPGVLVFPRYGEITLHSGPTQSGGTAVEWFCRAFGKTPSDMAEAATRSDFRHPVALFLPHLAGERAPLWDANARGTFLGLSSGMDDADMARAVYEGVALAVRLLFEALDASATIRPDTVGCGGGGFASDIWNQIRADVLDRRLKRLAVRHTGVLGAAAIACVAAGLQPDLAHALDDIVTYDREYAPNPERRALYDDLFGLYRPAYEAARDINHALVRLRAG
ncbi:MAG: xylulokinase [Inquilinaceae bacterium]